MPCTRFGRSAAASPQPAPEQWPLLSTPRSFDAVQLQKTIGRSLARRQCSVIAHRHRCRSTSTTWDRMSTGACTGVYERVCNGVYEGVYVGVYEVVYERVHERAHQVRMSGTYSRLFLIKSLGCKSLQEGAPAPRRGQTPVLAGRTSRSASRGTPRGRRSRCLRCRGRGRGPSSAAPAAIRSLRSCTRLCCNTRVFVVTHRCHTFSALLHTFAAPLHTFSALLHTFCACAHVLGAPAHVDSES